MAATKGWIVKKAYAELALAGYVFDLQPDEIQAGVETLEAMVATWELKSIRIGYAMAASPDDASADDDSGLPLSANEPVYMNLAVRLAAGFGKQLPARTLLAAKEGLDALSIAAAFPSERQYPDTLPRGQGNKPWRTANRPFMGVPDDDPLQDTGRGDDLEILSE